jgi:hypothetical protein
VGFQRLNARNVVLAGHADDNWAGSRLGDRERCSGVC